MDWITVFGYLGAALTTIAFFPQVIKIYKDHDTKAISLGMFIIFSVGVAFWCIYGIFLGEIPIILANGITLLLSCYILAAKIKYR